MGGYGQIIFGFKCLTMPTCINVWAYFLLIRHISFNLIFD